MKLDKSFKNILILAIYEDEQNDNRIPLSNENKFLMLERYLLQRAISDKDAVV